MMPAFLRRSRGSPEPSGNTVGPKGQSPSLSALQGEEGKGSVWRYVLSLLVILIGVATLVPAAARAGEETVRIGWLSQAVKRSLPLSYLDQPPQDEGVQGARLGIADNETTGHFTGQSFALVESIVPENGEVSTGFHELAAKGIRLIVTDLAAAELLSVAGMPEAPSVTFFNA